MRSISGVITQVSKRYIQVRLETGACVWAKGSGSVYSKVQVTFDKVCGCYRNISATTYDDQIEPEPIETGEYGEKLQEDLYV